MGRVTDIYARIADLELRLTALENTKFVEPVSPVKAKKDTKQASLIPETEVSDAIEEDDLDLE